MNYECITIVMVGTKSAKKKLRCCLLYLSDLQIFVVVAITFYLTAILSESCFHKYIYIYHIYPSMLLNQSVGAQPIFNAEISMKLSHFDIRICIVTWLFHCDITMCNRFVNRCQFEVHYYKFVPTEMTMMIRHHMALFENICKANMFFLVRDYMRWN